MCCLEWDVVFCGDGVTECFVVDAREAFVVVEIDGADSSVSVLGEYEFAPVFVVVFAAANEQDHVGVLFDGSRFSEVGELGSPHSAFGGPCLDGSVELGKEYDGYFELLCYDFCHAGGGGYFLLAVVMVVVGAHVDELEVVDE